MAIKQASVAAFLLALGCSAGGSREGSTVNPGSSGGGGPPVLGGPGTTPSSGQPPASGGPLFEPSELEPTDECDGELPVVYRDFSEAHPDFEMEFSGDVVRRQLIAPELGPDGKPRFLDSVGCPAQQGTPTACADWQPERPVITSAQTFDQWYRDVSGVNVRVESTLTLTETPPGSGVYTYNSNEFFPIPSNEGLGPTPANNNPQNRNFLFTTEMHLTFQYIAGQRFTFRGDDDLWIFVNGRLALDLGSMHGAEQGTIDFDAQAESLGIFPGQGYPMDIFHAERHTNASNFGVETNISCFIPSIPR